ncbi:MAG: hypothetical protein WCJ35_17990 [Planctomycetota bacterium]
MKASCHILAIVISLAGCSPLLAADELRQSVAGNARHSLTKPVASSGYIPSLADILATKIRVRYRRDHLGEVLTDLRGRTGLEAAFPRPLDGAFTFDLMADLQERIRITERRATEVREQVIALSHKLVDEREVAKAMSVFDPVWGSLAPREQARVIQLLVERVDYDGASGKVSITFHPSGIRTLADELAGQNTEGAA